MSKSSRARPNIKNKIENRAQVSATSVFHQLLCRSIVLCKLISRCHYHVVCCHYAKFVLIVITLQCNSNYLAYPVVTHRARVVSFVPYVVSVSKFRVFSHCASLCLKYCYQFLFSTFIILYYCWYFMYSLILNDLLNSLQNNDLIKVDKMVAVKRKSD